MPSILVLLRNEIVNRGGYQMEGIFRLGGEELKMLKMKSDLNKRQWTPSDDVFGMAALIKVRRTLTPLSPSFVHDAILVCIAVVVVPSFLQRWYGEMPVRVFEKLPLADLEVRLHQHFCCAETAACTDSFTDTNRSTRTMTGTGTAVHCSRIR